MKQLFDIHIENLNTINSDNHPNDLALLQHIDSDMTHKKGKKQINQDISNSIRYALLIQQSILPSKMEMNTHFNSFTIYKPKDIVSGDFYWFSNKLSSRRSVFSLLDCTGHGVPGAFLSILAYMFLNEIVNEKKIYQPAKILDFLNASFINKFSGIESLENKVGMDMSVCLFEKLSTNKHTVTYSGAKSAIYIYRQKQQSLDKLLPTRRSVGYALKHGEDRSFSNQVVELETGDMVYLLSDGIIDQPSAEREKFGRIKLETLFTEIAHLPMNKQHERIETELTNHCRGVELRDDVTVVGIELL